MLAQYLLSLKNKWFSNTRNDLLSGTLVALALIPEAIAFSIIAGVDPKVGLYASFCIAVIIAFTGGRSGMISAATGAMALVLASLVKNHGLQYMFAATILTGLLQLIAGFFKFGNLMRFISRAVVTGFVNALAILIFLAQLTEFKSAGPLLYLMVASGLGIIYLLPRFTKSIPSPLVCIVILTVISIVFKMDLRCVGDMGQIPGALPIFSFPQVPLNLETLKIIFPYAITLSLVGLLESLMTATIVDDLTATTSDKNQECKGQGIANFVTGFFGGMAGCGMIGQTIINIKTGARSRLSTLWAGMFLLFLIVVLGEWVKQIPMAALVSVMIMVSIGTFDWKSITNIKKLPLSSTIVMCATVITVILTDNLAMGAGLGILLSALFFSNKVEKLLKVELEELDKGKTALYKVTGELFFASTDKFTKGFSSHKTYSKVIIDVSKAHFWDCSAVQAIDKIVDKMQSRKAQVNLIGMNVASRTILEKLSTRKNARALDCKQI